MKLTAKWIDYFSKMAFLTASMSTDTTKVGCVIVGKDKNVLSTGYNGFPRGVIETEERKRPENKLLYTCHAEANALDLAKSSVEGSFLFSTHHPCANCAKSIIQKGISTVFYCDPMDNERWATNVQASKEMFLEAKIECLKIDLVESLYVVEEISQIQTSFTNTLITRLMTSLESVSSSMEKPKVQIRWQDHGLWIEDTK